VTSDETTPTEPVPLVIVEHGDPSDEELAALTAVIAARQSATSAMSRRLYVQSAWTDRRRLVRRPMHPGPGQWHAAGLPR
jgi:hypothetical protein